MSRRRTNTANYAQLPTDERDEFDGYTDEQFVAPPSRTKWKAILLILIFMIVGAICLTFSILISTGYFDERYADRARPLLIMGIIMFIPGGYFGYILLCISLKRDGFTIDDIPTF